MFNGIKVYNSYLLWLDRLYDKSQVGQLEYFGEKIIVPITYSMMYITIDTIDYFDMCNVSTTGVIKLWPNEKRPQLIDIDQSLNNFYWHIDVNNSINNLRNGVMMYVVWNGHQDTDWKDNRVLIGIKQGKVCMVDNFDIRASTHWQTLGNIVWV